MTSISTFFTAYSALRGGRRVEAIAVLVLDGPEPEHRYIVVDDLGASSIVRPEELDLYGVVDDAREGDVAPSGAE